MTDARRVSSVSKGAFTSTLQRLARAAASARTAAIFRSLARCLLVMFAVAGALGVVGGEALEGVEVGVGVGVFVAEG